MGTTTPRAGLYKPDENGERVDVAKLNGNFDILDALIKGQEVTSTTRPVDPVAGQVIYESDKRRWLGWDEANSRWIFVGGQIEWKAVELAVSWSALGTADQVGSENFIKAGIGPGHRVYIPDALIAGRTTGQSLAAGTTYEVIPTGKFPEGWCNSDNMIRQPYFTGQAAAASLRTFTAATWRNAPATPTPTLSRALDLNVGAAITIPVRTAGSGYIAIPGISWDLPASVGL